MQQHHIDHTFNAIAPLQTFALQTLINEAERIKQCYIPPLKKDLAKVGEALNTDSIADLGTSTGGSPYNMAQQWQKNYSNAHTASLILQHMKAQGIEKLELDSSRNWYEQVIEMAIADPEKCPPGARISRTNAYSMTLR